MYYLLFSLYFTIGCFLITKISFVQKTALSKNWILLLFSWKVFCGLALGWITQRYFPSNDYWGLNKLGIEEWELLCTNPKDFFTNITYSPYHNYTGFFNSMGSYWNDLRNNIVIKIIALTNNCSQGNYYINSLFFNFIGFLGHLALFRIFIHIYPEKKKWILIGCFFLPTTMLYTSGIHKDLLTFVALSFLCYSTYFSVQNKMDLKKGFLFFISILILLFVRNYVLMAVIPALIYYLLVTKKKIRPSKGLLLVYGTIFSGLILIDLFIPKISPLTIISQKQFDFLQLPCANTDLHMTVLEASVRSFVFNLPEAIQHGFFRPFLWDKGNIFLHISSIELMIYLGIIFWGVIKLIKQSIVSNWVIFFLLLTFTLFVFIGYTIPNSGSIVRYRSIYMPFLITPLLCSIYSKVGKNTN